jgi:hypothetical protein
MGGAAAGVSSARVAVEAVPDNNVTSVVSAAREPVGSAVK